MTYPVEMKIDIELTGTPEQLAYALHCSNTEGSKCIREKCPYFFVDNSEDAVKFVEEHGLSVDFLEGCDFGQIGLEAEALIRHVFKIENGKGERNETD